MSFEDDAAAFFRAEAERTQQLTESELLLREIDNVILTELDLQGAAHLWHPDAETSDRNIAELAHTYETEHPLAELEILPEALARIAFIKEISLINGLAMTLASKRFGLSQKDEESDKKQLLAKLLVGGYNEGWIRAVNTLLKGDGLDFQNEDDLQIYIDEAQKELEKPHNPLAQAMKSISPNASPRLFYHLLLGRNKQVDRPDAEAYIDELVREGTIDNKQADQLRGLLDS